MKTLFILLLTASSLCAATIDRERFLHALALVESNDNPRAVGRAGELGAHQVSRIALKEVGGRFRGTATARAVLGIQFTRMTKARVPITVETAALAWNMGITGARRRGWRSTDYSRRVKNIYFDNRTRLGFIQ